MNKYAFLVPALLMTAVPCFSAPSVSKPSDVELTIYNQNFALIKEERAMTLDKGMNTISVPDVAATIQANTVAFKSKTDPNGVAVREQNYEYDLLSPASVLNKSVGKKIIIRRYIDGKVETTEGILMSRSTGDQPSYDGRSMGGGLVVKTDRGILFFPSNLISSGEIEYELPELPEGLMSVPTLMWKLQADKGGDQTTEISYLANGMSWNADYVAVVDPLDKYIDLTGWVTLTNNSGTTFDNAKLNLMAGDVRRVEGVPGFGGGAAPRAVFMAKADESQFAEKSFFEYHLYTLAGRTTVKDRETKQITLMTASRVPVNKVYIYEGRKDWWSSWRYNTNYHPGESYDESQNKKVNIILEVMNNKENNLGLPLPKGTVRTYKQEVDSNRHFVGEDTIDHTPKDEKIRLYLGDAFDVVGEHRRVNFRRISQNQVEETFEITLRNHKDTPVTVNAVEHLMGSWTITESTHKYFKKDASTVEIPVEIAKDGEVKVRYTVKTVW